MSVDRLSRRIGAASAQLIDIRDRFRRVDPDDREGFAGSVGRLHDLLDRLHGFEIELGSQLTAVTAVIEEAAGRKIERQRHRDLLDLVPVATLMTTPTGLIQSANRAAADLLGVPVDSLIGKPLAGCIGSPRGAVTFVARLRQLRGAVAGPLVYEEQLRAQGGRAFTAHVTVSAVHSSAGVVAGLQWVIQEPDDAGMPLGPGEHRPRRVLQSARDVAQISQAEARRRLLASAEGAAAYYRSLFDGALDAIVLFDPERRLFDGNAVAQKMLGYADHELERLRLDDLAVSGAEAIDAVMEAVCRDGVWHGAMDLRRQDGATIPVNATISTMDSPVGLTYRAKFWDVSALRRSQEEHSRAQRERVAMIGHELANPLNGMLLHAELLRMMGCYREGSVDAILTAIRQVQRLIDDLLDEALTGANRQRLQLSRVDLVEIVRSGISSCRAGTRTPVIRLDAPDGLPAGFWDRDRILQVIVNLLSNATKYSPRDSEIQVSVEDLRDRVRVSVVDQGAGIEPDALPHVFDRFFQANPGNAQTHGLGLGLHIVKSLVEAHRGEITVESEAGAGSAFRVTLPYAPWEHEIDV